MPRTTILCASAVVAFLANATYAQTLPPVPAPPQNPITEAKRVLGKALFWDVQLSSDSTIACGTCHVNGSGGADPRIGRHPGNDGVLFTPDDKRASFGVVRADSNDDYTLDALFGLERQVTSRAANTTIMAAYAPELFWDGRASGTFVDPETGLVSIPAGGALESQVVGPPLSDVEMAHEARNWPQITARLATARPLACATDIPADVAAVLAGGTTYPQLFDDAFGDPAITAERIAFAIATYERTLIPDQTPWDLFEAGDPNALTPLQQQGLDTFNNPASACSLCHTPPFFTDHTFRNIGVRPIPEDRGRFDVTGNPADDGRFKVPTLRNAGLKETFMHNGQHTTLSQVVDFYIPAGGQQQFPQNIDPLIPPINIPPPLRAGLVDFLENGLTDPRVANEVFPFDRPTLHTELAPNPAPAGGGVGGTNGVPSMVALVPPALGNPVFKIGVENALPGSQALVAFSRQGPAPDGTLVSFAIEGPVTVSADGVATFHWHVPDDASLLGADLYMQWMVVDPGADGGMAMSPATKLTFFAEDPTTCGCTGDLDCSGSVDVTDLIALIAEWGPCDVSGADLNDDGAVDVSDLLALFAEWGSVCP